MLNAEKALRFGAVRKLTSLCSASTDKQKSTPARQTAAANAGSRNHSATVMPSLLTWEAGVGRPARPPGARGPSGSLLGVGLHPGRDVFLLLVLAWSPLHSLGASGVGRVCLPCGSVCSLQPLSLWLVFCTARPAPGSASVSQGPFNPTDELCVVMCLKCE